RLFTLEHILFEEIVPHHLIDLSICAEVPMKCMDGRHPIGFHYHSLAQPTFSLKQTFESSQNLLVRPQCVCLSRESGLHLLKGSLVNDRREGSCLCYPRLWSLAKTLTTKSLGPSMPSITPHIFRI